MKSSALPGKKKINFQLPVGAHILVSVSGEQYVKTIVKMEMHGNIFRTNMPVQGPKLLNAILDEDEFLSPYGIRSISKKHTTKYEIEIDKQLFTLNYDPGESTIKLFGSNSNWRGPIWFPMNYLIIRSLKAYYQYFGNEFKVEFPSRSGNFLNLKEVAIQLDMRLQKIFLTDQDDNRPVFGRHKDFYRRAENKELILFHEYFNGETGMGLGASHQTGWTGLIATLIQEMNEESPS